MRALIVLMAWLFAMPTFAAVLPANPTNWQAVIDTAKPGDVVKLDAGVYTTPFRWGRKTYSPPLTIDATAATIKADLYWGQVDGVTFKGGTWYKLRVDTANNLTFDGVTYLGTRDATGLFLYGGGKIKITASTFAGYNIGLSLLRIDGFDIQRSAFESMRSDGMRLAESRNGLVAFNVFQGTRVDDLEHPDCIQLWSRPTSPPTADIIIRGNFCVGQTQGIGAFNHTRDGINDGGFDRLTIEDNLIVAGYPQGLAIYEARDTTLRNNRVVTYPRAQWRASINDPGATYRVRCGNVVEPGAGKGGVRDAVC